MNNLNHKIIEILVSPQGETRIETKGFVGSECRRASQFLESALGRQTSEQLTAQFHLGSQQQQQRVQES